uniref:Uncharacterized protein n=1 Tax=Pararge aegeria TaxID=116150 RepID=S4P1I9_9NEOP
MTTHRCPNTHTHTFYFDIQHVTMRWSTLSAGGANGRFTRCVAEILRCIVATRLANQPLGPVRKYADKLN